MNQNRNVNEYMMQNNNNYNINNINTNNTFEESNIFHHQIIQQLIL